MSNVKFSQLPNLGNITANTIVPVVAAGTNYTVTAANLQSYVNSSTGNITAGNIRTGGLISATGNVTSGNVSIVGGTLAFANSSIVQSNPLDLSITGVYQISVKPAGGSYQWTFGNDGALTGPTGLGVTGYVSATGNATAGNIRTAGLVSATANITGGNILTAGLVSATGNITGNYFIGNGSQLTGIASSYGNANVVANLAALGSNPVSTTGNVTGGNVLTAGLISSTGSTNTLNLVTRNGDANPVNSKTQIAMGYNGTTDYSQFVHTRHNAGSSAYNTIELWTSDGTQAGTFPANAILGLTVSNSRVSIGNSIVNPGNTLDVGGNLYSTGNITGNYILGNGALLTGVITSVANINSGTSNVTVVSSGGNITVGVGGTSNVAVFATTGEYVTGVVSASGNVTGGNVLTAGVMSSTGNATHGNILTAGVISATGNITGGNISATNHTGTTVSITGNITAGNVINTGISSVTGNITAGNVLTGGVVSATGNITTANYFVGNLVGTTVSTTGNVYAGNVIINGQSTTYGVVTPAYMVVGLVTSVSGFGNGSTFILDTVISNTNSQTSYNASTGVFTLTAGVTYDMSFTPSFITFSNTTGGFFCYDWVDATSNVQLDTTGTGTGTSISSQDTTAQQDNGTARVIYTPNTNQTVKLRVTNASGTVTLRGGIGTQAIIKPLNPTIAVQATSFGNVSASGYVSATGNVTAANFFGNGSTLSNVATQVTGSWTVPTGNSTQSFTVAASETYYMWVDCNIPNGILAWNATATITNTNVPVVGVQYAWVYNGGGTPIDFTSIPNQFVGTANSIVRSSTAPSATTNRFDFGINNTSGNSQTVRYGWVTIS
jgi:filamentous hemagglutinin